VTWVLGPTFPVGAFTVSYGPRTYGAFETQRALGEAIIVARRAAMLNTMGQIR
jgi:hypothetical protein